MKICILGTRGIPNHYGGFEQFAEYLSLGLVKKGHDVTVYNSSSHPYQNITWNGVKLVHCSDPEDKWGTVGQFIYDFNCILHSRKQNFDIILQLGYTSNSVWGWLLPKKSIIVTNMDGLEWKRTKFSPKVRQFLKKAESWGVASSDYLVADSIGIQQHLKDTYKKDSTYIPYGSHVFENPNSSVLAEFKVSSYKYDMLVARLEPENSIEIILDGASKVNTRPFLVIGKHHTKYGTYLKDKFAGYEHIKFIGGVYDINKLDNLRYYSNIYFHGHTVGGTNPSLLEAMGSSAFICAHNNIFNRAILETEAVYFNSANEVSEVLINHSKERFMSYVAKNIEKIERIYHWPIIIDQYEELLLSTINQSSSKKVII